MPTALWSLLYSTIVLYDTLSILVFIYNIGKMTIEANKVTLTVYVNEQHYAYEQ